MYGRQYLKAEDIEEYKVKFDGAVHFLDKVICLGQKAAVGEEGKIEKTGNITGITFSGKIGDMILDL